MSCTDLTLLGRPHSALLNRNCNMKKSRSLSLTNITHLKRNSYDHVESKVKQYIKQIKETNGQKGSQYQCNNMSEDISNKINLNIDANILTEFCPLNGEADLTIVQEKVKNLMNSPNNLEKKVKYISQNPQAVFCLLRLLFEERKLRYEQDLTMKTLQLNYDNLLAKYANTKNSIDSFRLSQEVLTDLKSNSSYFSAPISSSLEIKKAYSTPDLSFIDISNTSDMLIKTSYVPVVDPNMGIKLSIENPSQSKIINAESSAKFGSNSRENLKTIWIQIFKNLREKIKKCVLLEKNFALDGEDKTTAWSSIHNDFKCLYDIANYQEDIRRSFEVELEDLKFVIHKYSLEFLGSSLIMNGNPDTFSSQDRKPIFMEDNSKVTPKAQSHAEKMDKLFAVSNRENDSGCLTSDCSPHPSLNDTMQNKPYYTTSNNVNTECKHSDVRCGNQWRINDISSKTDHMLYSQCSARKSAKNLLPSDNKVSCSCRDNRVDNKQIYRCVKQRRNSEDLVTRDSVSRSPTEAEKQRKYASSFVRRSSTSDSPPSSRNSSYDLYRLENNFGILKKNVQGIGSNKGENSTCSERNPIDNQYKNLPPTCESKQYRSLSKHESMQSIDCNNSNNVFEDSDNLIRFCTSTPKKGCCENHEQTGTNSKRIQSRTKERKSSVRHRSKSLFNFGNEIAEVLEITEALKNQSRELLVKYKHRTDMKKS